MWHGEVSAATQTASSLTYRIMDRAVLRAQKAALVQMKMGVEDLRAGVATTRARLAKEQADLATVTRRRDLAAGINDAETVRIAEPFLTQHAERVAVLERKLAAQAEELALTERELAAMTAHLKGAALGIGDTPPPRGPTDAELGLPDDAPLRSALDALGRAARRSAAEQDAEARLAELKRRMGRE